jgi:hypothetical protein
MTRTLETRIEALEKAQGEGWQPFAPATDAEWDEHLAGMGISTTAQEAAAKGYSSIAHEMASRAGLTLAESSARMNAEAQEYEGAHEWTWIRGRCCIRERGRR